MSEMLQFSKRNLQKHAARLSMCSNHLSTSSSTSSSNYTLQSAPKTQSFTKYLTPDPRVPSVEFASDPNTPDEYFRVARRILSGAYTWCKPEQRKEYRFLLASEKSLEALGLDPETEPKSEWFQKIVSGQEIVQDPFPYAQAYAGYQFGDFAGQLGDGRVVNLFEVTNPKTNERYELQLKGAGLTPFSRFADGKAVLRSSIREFVISESLAAIGIPTTRALAITALPKTYAQRGAAEKCAIVCRMAPSWVRIGTFDLYRMRGDRKGLLELSNYVIDHVFGGEENLVAASNLGEEPELKLGGTSLTKYDKMYFEIVMRNARTVAYWHAYGFLNGVLNTDNTSILGLSIDFGPFAFMDTFDPDYSSNHDDHSLRYSFRNTPSAIYFNLVKLGEDVAELIGAGPELLNNPQFYEEKLKEEWKGQIISRAEKIIDIGGELYEKIFIDEYLNLVCKRLGISPRDTDHTEVLAPMFEMLKATKLDYNRFFTILQSSSIQNDIEFDYDKVAESFIPENFKEDEFTDYTKEKVLGEIKGFLAVFKARVHDEKLLDTERLKKAKHFNPLFLPRTWILEDVIEYTKDNDYDTKYLEKVLKMSSNPYDKSKWGDDLKDIELKWCQDAEIDRQMLQCNCSS